MDALAEGQVRVGVTADVEAPRVDETLWVVVGRPQEEGDRLACLDGLAAHFDLVECHPRSQLHRTVITQ